MSVPSEFLPKCSICDHPGRIYQRPGCDPVTLCAQHAAEMKWTMGLGDLEAAPSTLGAGLANAWGAMLAGEGVPTERNVAAFMASLERQMEGR